MTKRRVDYLSYLLRLWRVNGDEDQDKTYQPVWRASLEDPQTGEQRGFASLDSVFDFLSEQIHLASEPGKIEHKGER
jgi:hypothetical protein